MSKNEVFKVIKEKLNGIKKGKPILIGIDGIDGAGKSYFAKNLAKELKKNTKEVTLSSIDYFHNPKRIRYKKGADSHEGFYFDSYNYDELKKALLNPFYKGRGEYKLKAFDCDKDKIIDSPLRKVKNQSILIMEGIFLLRPELIDYWDLKIFLDIDFETALKRNIERNTDQKRIGSKEKIIKRYKKRYQPGQELYLKEANPKSKADIIINNSDYKIPIVKKRA